jgi:prevent-host-death family protein
MYILMYIEHVARKYSVAEARVQLPSILDQIESGSSVELTRRGRSVAVMVSVDEYERLRAERVAFKDAYARFLKRHRLSEIGVSKDFAKRARDRSAGRKVEL